MKQILSILALLLSLNVFALVRFNPNTGLWEGNICMTNLGWAYVEFQPIGSVCFVETPQGRIIGRIVNG